MASHNNTRLQEWVYSKLRNGGGTCLPAPSAITTTFVSVDADALTGEPTMTPAQATHLLADVLVRCSASHPEEGESVYDCSACSPCMKGCLLWISGSRRRHFLIAPPRMFRHFGSGECFPPASAVEKALSSGARDEMQAACGSAARPRSFMYVFTADLVKECIAREIVPRCGCISQRRRGCTMENGQKVY